MQMTPVATCSSRCIFPKITTEISMLHNTGYDSVCGLNSDPAGGINGRDRLLRLEGQEDAAAGGAPVAPVAPACLAAVCCGGLPRRSCVGA